MSRTRSVWIALGCTHYRYLESWCYQFGTPLTLSPYWSTWPQFDLNCLSSSVSTTATPQNHRVLESLSPYWGAIWICGLTSHSKNLNQHPQSTPVKALPLVSEYPHLKTTCLVLWYPAALTATFVQFATSHLILKFLSLYQASPASPYLVRHTIHFSEFQFHLVTCPWSIASYLIRDFLCLELNKSERIAPKISCCNSQQPSAKSHPVPACNSTQTLIWEWPINSLSIRNLAFPCAMEYSQIISTVSEVSDYEYSIDSTTQSLFALNSSDFDWSIQQLVLHNCPL